METAVSETIDARPHKTTIEITTSDHLKFCIDIKIRALQLFTIM